MAVRLAYKSSSNFSQTRSASGKFFTFSAAKASERAGARLVFPEKNRLKSRHLARTICVPVACVVASCQSMSKQTNNGKNSDKSK